MNLPNKITLLRIILTFLFVICLFLEGLTYKVLALAFFLMAAVSDYLDGWVARKYGLVSDFGRIMDPVADKVLTISAFLSFMVMGIVPFVFVVLIVTRDILVTGFRLKALASGKVLPAIASGKNKTVSQIFSILVILLFVIFREADNGLFRFWNADVESVYHKTIYVLMGLTCFLTIASGAAFFKKNHRFF